MVVSDEVGLAVEGSDVVESGLVVSGVVVSTVLEPAVVESGFIVSAAATLHNMLIDWEGPARFEDEELPDEEGMGNNFVFLNSEWFTKKLLY